MTRNASRFALFREFSRSGRSSLLGPSPTLRHKLRPQFWELEDRLLLANLTVMNTNASGNGSLAAVVATANGNNQANTITFSQSAFGSPQTITLGGQLRLSDTAGSQTITGPAAGVTISGGGSSRVFAIASGVTATLSGLTITKGACGYSSGGGLTNGGTVTLTGCTISGNNAEYNGGGVYNGGTAILTGCTISGNSASVPQGEPNQRGGGIYNQGQLSLTGCTITGNSAPGYGGGLFNQFHGVVNLTDCTLSANSGSNGGAFLDQGKGVNASDCTFTGNSAYLGGAIENEFGADILDNCTISGNSANIAGGVQAFGTTILTDTIVAGNTTTNGASDIKGSISGSYNLIGTGGAGGLTNGADHNIVLTSLAKLGLAPLGPYGGPTQTMAILPGSAAIGKGTGTDAVTTDQRGLPLDSPPDIGAFQSQSTLTVNTTLDGNTTPSGDLSLRQAINIANSTDTANPNAVESITFDSTVFAASQTIVLTQGPLKLTSSNGSETITGPAADVTINGNGGSEVFDVGDSTTATLSGLTITGGGGSYTGGGLINGGTVSLTDCTLSGNSANQSGGGLDNQAVATLVDCTIDGNSANKNGAGVSNSGTAILTDCTISGNSAGSNQGGGLDNMGRLTLTDCTVSANSADSGGGLFNAGVATLTGTIVAGNTKEYGIGASDIAGAVTGTYNLVGTGGSGGITGGSGGNIVLKSLTNLGLAPLAFYGGSTETMALLPGSEALGAGTSVTGVSTDQRGFKLPASDPDIGAFQAQSSPLVVNSTADGSACPPGKLDLRGAVDLANVLTGDQSITFDKNVFATAQTITLTGSQLVLSNTSGSETITGPAAGVAVSGGGAIGVFAVDSGVTAVFSGLTIEGGSVILDGGGLENNGTATLADCTISGNTAGLLGGGLNNDGTLTLTQCTISGNSSPFGAGLFNNGMATLAGCTLSANTAAKIGGGLNNGVGAHVILSDCTISGNSTGTLGGGLYNYDGGTVSLTACTISANTSKGLGGGLASAGTASLTDTIVAGNTKPSGASDIHNTGTLTGSYDLIGTGGSGPLSNGSDHNIVLTSLADLGLAPLGTYGGPNQTMALLPGSVALGAGTAASAPSTDQRGMKLAQPAPDIGAFQSQGFTTTVVKSATPQTAWVNKAFANPLSVVVAANNPSEPVAGGVVSFAAPSSGASAALSGATATIGSGGVASVIATANSSTGSYMVVASAPGFSATADFSLTNSQATAAVVAVPHIVYRNKKVVSLSIEAEIEPVNASAGMPTGTVTFELVEKNHKFKVLVKATLKGGKATLDVGKPSTVLNKSIKVVYSGDTEFEPNELTKLIQATKKSKERS
jgi:fibronectin-binding autotransporter adhesin